MTIKVISETIQWDAGPTGTTGYDILINGIKKSSTIRALKAQFTLSDGDIVRVVAQPSGEWQEITFDYSVEIDTPLPLPPTTDSDLIFSLWWQSPPDAKTYHDAGFTHYLGGDRGAGAQYISTLGALGMKWLPFTSDQAAVLAIPNQDKVVIGWAATDEPDNAQFGSPRTCMSPLAFQSECQNAKNNDPLHRLIHAGMGYQLGWLEGDISQPPSPRGSLCCNPASRQYGDYFDYYKYADLASGDVYPVNYNWNNGDLVRVADYQDNLNIYAIGKRHIATLECGPINSTGPRASLTQMKCELWLALIHGATWIDYFPQANMDTTTPIYNELARNSTVLAGVKAMITEAQASSVPICKGTPVVTSGKVLSPIRVDYMQRNYSGANYIFATAPRTSGIVSIPVASPAGTTATVIGENRVVPVINGAITDDFHQYAVHAYKIG